MSFKTKIVFLFCTWSGWLEKSLSWADGKAVKTKFWKLHIKISKPSSKNLTF